jgi:tRNA-dihydrouridine synthase B
MNPTLLLAPIRGITDRIYRNLHVKYFPGFDGAVAPFIAASKQINFERKLLREFEPENINFLHTIPQILSRDPDDFIPLANALFSLGHPEVNWNLGCPHPVVTNKKKGSGLLRYPAQIEAFLEKTIPSLQGKLSIKLRLGFECVDDIFQLLPIFNRYPLTELIIHPRTGRQMYDGVTDKESFEKCVPLTAHRIVYNGDINSLHDYNELSARFTSVTRWMIGRGALRNPFLPGEIKKGKELSPQEKTEIIRCFHNDLYNQYAKTLSSPAHILDKMKGHWFYLADTFPEQKKLFKTINKITGIDRYNEYVRQIFIAGK